MFWSTNGHAVLFLVGMVLLVSCSAQQVATKDETERLGGEISAAGNKLLMVVFNRAECKLCKRLAPLVDQLAEDKANEVTLLKSDLDASAHYKKLYGLEVAPTFVFLRRGKKLKVVRQPDIEDVQYYVTKYLKPEFMDDPDE